MSVFTTIKHSHLVFGTFNLRNIFVCREDKFPFRETTISGGSSYEMSDHSAESWLNQLPNHINYCPQDKLSNLYHDMNFLLIFRIEEDS